MKEWAHLITASGLALMSSILFIMTQSNDNTRPLDVARFYTMKRAKGDTDAALNYVKDQKLWPTEQCQAMVNLSTDAACLKARVDIRDNILHHMKCTQFGSQACSYLRLTLRALARNSTVHSIPANPLSPLLVVGSNLKLKAPNGESFGQIFENIINDAPKLLHGGVKAVQSDNTIILRSMLYNLITMSILANLITHVADKWMVKQDGWVRAAVRSLTFVLVFGISLIFLFMYTGAAMVLLVIAAASLVTLVYFEMFLDKTIVRPWIHPHVFTTIYMSTCVLALIDNGILDYNIIVVHLLTSMCVSQLYMAMTWFYVGASEKRRLPEPMRHLFIAYTTKETQFALLGCIVLCLLVPIHQVLSPYNFTYNSIFLTISPIVFAFIGVLSILVIQDMTLDEDTLGHHETKQKPDATAITGGKIYTSMLLLLYGLVITIIFFTDHVKTYRAFLDNVVEKSILYDLSPSRSFLMGQGLTPLSAS